MANLIQESLAQLSGNIDRLTARIEELYGEKIALEQENEELNMEVRRLWEENKGLRSDVEYLQISHRLAQDPDQVVATRRRIAAMIREVDRCIEQLKE